MKQKLTRMNAVSFFKAVVLLFCIHRRAESREQCYTLDLEPLNLEIYDYSNDEVESKAGEVKYHYLDSTGTVILTSNASSSQVCIDDSDNCNFLYFVGNGGYNVTENGEDSVLRGGIVHYDNPELLQMGDCRHICGPENLQLMFFGEAEDTPVLFDANNQVVRGRFHKNNEKEVVAVENEEAIMRLMCIHSSQCYTLVGSALYKVSNNDMLIVEEGSTYYGDRTFGDCPSKCQDLPLLAETGRGQDIVLVASTLSGMEVFTNFQSPQYQAACWLIYDDARQLSASDYNLLQRYILAVLFYSLGGLEWAMSFDFLSWKHECQWHKWVHEEGIDNYVNGFATGGEKGIHCDELGYVSGITLQSNEMVGSIPVELFFLKQMRYLDFDDNSISGSIPSELGLLRELHYIGLRRNALTGSVPDSIDELPLQVIMLSDNLLTGTLPSTFQGDVHRLVLGANLLSGTIPDAITSLTSLQFLLLNENQLSGTIPEGIGNLTSMVRVHLYENSLRGVLPSNSLALPNLEHLALYDNSLTGTIPTLVATGSPLWWFDIEINSFTGTIPSDLSLLENLQYLYLDNNELTGEIPSTLPTLSNLIYFMVHENNVTGSILYENCDDAPEHMEADCDTPAKVLCPCCSGCHGILSSQNDDLGCSFGALTISYTNMDPGDRFWLFVYDSSGGVVDWEILSVKQNTHSFSTCLASSGCFEAEMFNYFKEWEMTIEVDGEVVMIETLTENSHHFFFGYSLDGYMKKDTCDNFEVCGVVAGSNSSKRALFDEVARVTGTRVLADTTSSHYKAVCRWIDFLDGKNDEDFRYSDLLQYFYLALLYFETNGDQWYDSSLWVTNTSQCDWYGIECDIYGVVTAIRLSSNNLRGPLSSEIGELRGLEYVELSYNYLIGEIPVEIAHLQRLVEFRVSSNTLLGSLPSAIGALKDLVILDLSFNELTNTLPSEIGELENIQVMSLYNNTFSGDLPDSFFYLTSLSVLNLGYNLFAGDARRVATFLNLEFVDLSDNFFTGIVPLGAHQNKLKVIQFAGNRFRGSIPMSIGELTSVETLFLYSNQLTGNLPSQIGNLQNLVNVSLSHNNIKGSLPSEMGRLKNLTLLQLQDNSLEGSGDVFDYVIAEYITDCGSTFTGPARIECASCSKCCNIDGNCISVGITWPKPGQSIDLSGIPAQFFVFFMVFLACSFILVVLRIYQTLDHVRSDFEFCKVFQEESAYKFLLTNSVGANVLAAATVAVQLLLLYIFLLASDFTRPKNDWEYSTSCPEDSIYCEDNRLITPLAWFAFGCVLFSYLAQDFFESLKMIHQSMLLQSRRKGVLAGFVVLYVTLCSSVASALYNYSTGISNTDVLKDAVILLFLNDIDESIYSLARVVNADWVEELNNQILLHFDKRIRKSGKVKSFRPPPPPSYGDDDDHEEDLEEIDLDRKMVPKRRGSTVLRDRSMEMLWDPNEEIFGLKNDVSKLQRAYTGLQKSHRELEKHCSTLETTCVNLEDKCSNLESKCSGLEQHSSNLEGVCSNLEAKCSGLEDKCSLFEREISYLKELIQDKDT